MNVPFSKEQDLIRRASAGDDSAFEELVNLFTPGLYRVLRRLLADRQETEAVLQETFWRVWRALPRYQNDRRFFPYIVTVGVNLARDVWRREHRAVLEELETLPEPASAQASPEGQLEDAQLLAALERAIGQLSLVQRAAIALRYEAGLSYAEIAAALDLPLNTVRTHLHRAKAALRERLKEVYG